MKKSIALTLLLSLGLALPALAQSAPASLVAAYRAGVAAEKCGLALDSAASSRLGDAVQREEQRSGLSQNDLDALWSKTQAEADADNAGFCANAQAAVQSLTGG